MHQPLVLKKWYNWALFYFAVQSYDAHGKEMPLPEGVYGLVSDLQHLIPCSETKFLVPDTFHGVCGCFEAELVNAYFPG